MLISFSLDFYKISLQIYGWGSNDYGQIGTTGAVIYKRPVHIEALNTEMCVAVTCGQYHTAALTHDGRCADTLTFFFPEIKINDTIKIYYY